MPVNRGVGVERLIKSCWDYFRQTGRRVSYEYTLFDGVNDTPYHAELLAGKLKGRGSHLNLILLNSVEERPFRPSAREHLNAFIKILDGNGIGYTIRRKLGGDIDASCGQLRGRDSGRGEGKTARM